MVFRPEKEGEELRSAVDPNQSVDLVSRNVDRCGITSDHWAMEYGTAQDWNHRSRRRYTRRSRFVRGGEIARHTSHFYRGSLLRSRRAGLGARLSATPNGVLAGDLAFRD